MTRNDRWEPPPPPDIAELEGGAHAEWALQRLKARWMDPSRLPSATRANPMGDIGDASTLSPERSS